FSLVLADEVGQYADPSLLDLLRSCLRAPPPIRPRFVLSANPAGPGHAWVAMRHVLPPVTPWLPYVEQKTGRQFVSAPSVFVDNPHLDQAEYARQLEAACATDPELLKAWRDGDWTVARGAFFASVLDQARVLIEPASPEALPRRR